MLSGVTHWHPQASYVRMQKYLQQGWAFVQRINQGVGGEFHPVEDALRRDFVLTLFHRVERHISVWDVTQLPINRTGLALPDPTLSSPEYCTASCIVTVHLLDAFQVRT